MRLASAGTKSEMRLAYLVRDGISRELFFLNISRLADVLRTRILSEAFGV